MILELASATLLLAALADDEEEPGRARYTGVTCPIATSELVDWSTDSWWYPTPTRDIEWPEFRNAVVLTPEVVMSSGYLPWKEGWEPWEEFLARPKAQYQEGFYATILPSGKRAWVWVGSGIEHWFTRDGHMDVHTEDAILARAYADLDFLEEEERISIDAAQVQRAIVAARENDIE